MGATPIDDNDADGKSGKLYGWLLIIRCTSLNCCLTEGVRGYREETREEDEEK